MCFPFVDDVIKKKKKPKTDLEQDFQERKKERKKARTESTEIEETSDNVRKGRDFWSIWSRRTRAPLIRRIMLRAIVLNPRHSYGTLPGTV